VVLLGVGSEHDVGVFGPVVGLDQLHERRPVVGEPAVDHDDGPFGASPFEVAISQSDGIATPRPVADWQEIDLVHLQRAFDLVRRHITRRRTSGTRHSRRSIGRKVRRWCRDPDHGVYDGA
jgi:hypothetical protein